MVKYKKVYLFTSNRIGYLTATSAVHRGPNTECKLYPNTVQYILAIGQCSQINTIVANLNNVLFKSVCLIYCSVAAVWPYWPNWTIWQAVYMSESRRSSGSLRTSFWGPKAWPSCRKPALLLPHTAALSGRGWWAKPWAWYTAHSIFFLNGGQTEITVFYLTMPFKKSSKK